MSIEDHLPHPADHDSFDAAQDLVVFLGCKGTSLAHSQLAIHQYPQVLFNRAMLHPYISQPVLIAEVATTHASHIALGFVEPHEVHKGQLLKRA